MLPRDRVTIFTVGGSFGVFKDSEDWVRVRYPDGRELDITKARYVASRRSPPFEALPLAEAFAKSLSMGFPAAAE
jgi:hypothetical protein